MNQVNKITLEKYLKDKNKPKKKLQRYSWKGFTFTRQEDILHYEAVQYIKEKYPKVKFQSNHMQGMSLKKTGQKYNPIIKNIAALNGSNGMPDLIIFKNNSKYAGLALELKKPEGRLTKEEKLVLEYLNENKFLSYEIGSKSIDIADSIRLITQTIDSYMEIE